MRKISFIVILLFAAGIFGLNLFYSKDFSKGGYSFASVFELAGKAPQALSRGVSKALPVNDLDEAEFGEQIKRNYAGSDSNKEKYLNEVIKGLLKDKRKRFEYKVFVDKYGSANAYAMPGGVIVVTEDMFEVLGSESELAAVLAHEVGHIELSHCFDAVKYKLLADKLELGSLGNLADYARNVLIKHSYSKTQEAEADEYAFALLENSKYDPAGEYKAFQRLEKLHDNPSKRNIVEDYFMSHPDISQRVLEYEANAFMWWHYHDGEKRYVGEKNLKKLMPMSQYEFDYEWVESSK